MKLKKIIINGKVLYEPVNNTNTSDDGDTVTVEDEEDMEGFSSLTDEAINTLKKEKEEYNKKNISKKTKEKIFRCLDKAIEDLIDATDDDEIDDILDDAIDTAEDIYEDDGDDSEDFFEGSFSYTKEFKNIKDIFKSKNNSIYAMLPFMNKHDLHDLMENILKDDEQVRNINIYALLPFLSKEDCDALFIRALEVGHKKINPIAVVPFVSKECLSVFVDEYIQGKYQDININGIYPFLDSKDVKRLFDYLVSKKN